MDLEVKLFYQLFLSFLLVFYLADIQPAGILNLYDVSVLNQIKDRIYFILLYFNKNIQSILLLFILGVALPERVKPRLPLLNKPSESDSPVTLPVFL